MKEIKAYVRASMASPVIQALSAEGDLDFSLIDVRGISRGLPRDSYEYSVELGEVFQSVVKLEIFCKDENVETLVEIIRTAAATGRKGDGVIFVSAVEEGIRILGGERGEAILSR